MQAKKFLKNFLNIDNFEKILLQRLAVINKIVQKMQQCFLG